MEKNRSAEQTNRPRTASHTQFVCPALGFMPYELRQKTLIPELIKKCIFS